MDFLNVLTCWEHAGAVYRVSGGSPGEAEQVSSAALTERGEAGHLERSLVAYVIVM